MLACHFIDPDLEVEKGDNKITLVLEIQENLKNNFQKNRF